MLSTKLSLPDVHDRSGLSHQPLRSVQTTKTVTRCHHREGHSAARPARAQPLLAGRTGLEGALLCAGCGVTPAQTGPSPPPGIHRWDRCLGACRTPGHGAVVPPPRQQRRWGDPARVLNPHPHPQPGEPGEEFCCSLLATGEENQTSAVSQPSAAPRLAGVGQLPPPRTSAPPLPPWGAAHSQQDSSLRAPRNPAGPGQRRRGPAEARSPRR